MVIRERFSLPSLSSDLKVNHSMRGDMQRKGTLLYEEGKYNPGNGDGLLWTSNTAPVVCLFQSDYANS